MWVQAHTESRQRYSVDADNKGCLAVMVTTDVTATQCPAVVPVLYLEILLVRCEYFLREAVTQICTPTLQLFCDRRIVRGVAKASCRRTRSIYSELKRRTPDDDL
jgi:hypothetical protein